MSITSSKLFTENPVQLSSNILSKISTYISVQLYNSTLSRLIFKVQLSLI